MGERTKSSPEAESPGGYPSGAVDSAVPRPIVWIAGVGRQLWGNRRPFGRAVGGVVAGASLVLAIGGLLHQVTTKVSVPSTWVLGLVLVAVASVAVGATVDRDRALYALESATRMLPPDAAAHLHSALHHLRHASFWLRSGVDSTYLSELGHACNEISLLFTALTGQPCRACIKALGYTGTADEPDWTDGQLTSQLVVETLQRSHTQPFDVTKDSPIAVTESSAFAAFWPPFSPKHWFIVNDIELAYEEGWYRNITRPRGTPSPHYNSAQVWPIQIDLRRTDSKFIPLGYFAVDSLATGVFNDTLGWVGAGLADACFTALSSSGELFSLGTAARSRSSRRRARRRRDAKAQSASGPVPSDNDEG